MPTINGREYQHATTDWRISSGGIPILIETMKKITIKVKGAKKPVRNSKGQVIGYTIDNAENDGSLSMLLSEWISLKAQVKQLNPGLFIGQIALDLTMTYGNSLAVLQTTKVFGLMFNEEGRESQDSQDPHSVDMPIFFLRATFEGDEFINYDAPVLQ